MNAGAVIAAGPRPAWTHRVLALLAVGCVALQIPGSLPLSALALALWLAALRWGDRGALRRLWRPKLLAWSAVIAVLAGLLLGAPDAEVLGVPVSSHGLAAGALMVVRGGLILGITSWLARRLVARALAPGGRRRALGAAAATAVELMPSLLDALSASWAGRPRGQRWRALEETGVAALLRAVGLAERLVAPAASRDRAVRVVTGPVGAGKTTALLAIRDRLVGEGLRVGGVVQPSVGTARDVYDLEDVATGERRRFAWRRPDRSGFSFDDAGWSWAAERIRAARAGCDVVVVDELGRLEAAGGGHLPALVAPGPEDRARSWLVAVREDAVGAIAARLGAAPTVFAPDERERVSESVLATARAKGVSDDEGPALA